MQASNPQQSTYCTYCAPTAWYRYTYMLFQMQQLDYQEAKYMPWERKNLFGPWYARPEKEMGYEKSQKGCRVKMNTRTRGRYDSAKRMEEREERRREKREDRREEGQERREGEKKPDWAEHVILYSTLEPRPHL